MSSLYKAFDEGNQQDAFGELATAFDMLLQDVSTDLPMIAAPPTFNIPERHLPRAYRDKVTNLVDTVRHSARTLNVLMLGIDPVKYSFFMTNTPHVARSISGVRQLTFHRKVGQPDTFDICFDFVIDSALTMAEVFRQPKLDPSEADEG